MKVIKKKGRHLLNYLINQRVKVAFQKENLAHKYFDFLSKKENYEVNVIYKWICRSIDQIDVGAEKLIQDLYSKDLPPEVPNVYVFWNSNIETAPEIIQWCYNELSQYGIENLQLIDASSLNQYDLLELHSLNKPKSWAHKTDLVRTELLFKYGGLWIDADTWSRRDLTDYFDLLIQTKKSFFAFSDNGFYNIRNGFMVARRGNYLLAKLLSTLKLLWKDKPFFANRISYHHYRWIFLNLCRLDERFRRDWIENSLTKDVKPNYTFSRHLIGRNNKIDSTIKYLNGSDIHFLSHYFPNVLNESIMEKAKELVSDYLAPDLLRTTHAPTFN